MTRNADSVQREHSFPSGTVSVKLHKRKRLTLVADRGEFEAALIERMERLEHENRVLRRKVTELLLDARNGSSTFVEHETCDRCGRGYTLVWAAEDDLWNEVIGSEHGKRCPDCFERDCNERGIYAFFVAFREHVVIADVPDVDEEAKERARVRLRERIDQETREREGP